MATNPPLSATPSTSTLSSVPPSPCPSAPFDNGDVEVSDWESDGELNLEDEGGSHKDDDNDDEDGNNDDNGSNSATASTRQPQRSRHSRMNMSRKLDMVMRAMRKARLSFRTFLIAWASRDVVLSSNHYKTLGQRQSTIRAVLGDPRLHVLRQRTLDAISDELDALVQTQQRYFGKFDSKVDIEQLDFEKAISVIQATAPTWFKMLSKLMKNKRSDWESYNAPIQTKAINGRIFLITSVVCHSRQKINSSLLVSSLDVYLAGTGVKRRVMEVLGGLGVCHGYHTARRLLNTVADEAKV